MKLNLPAVLLIFAGALLIYSAYRDDDPRNIIFETLGVKRRIDVRGWGKAGEAVAGAAKAIPVDTSATTPGVPVVSV